MFENQRVFPHRNGNLAQQVSIKWSTNLNRKFNREISMLDVVIDNKFINKTFKIITIDEPYSKLVNQLLRQPRTTKAVYSRVSVHSG